MRARLLVVSSLTRIFVVAMLTATWLFVGACSNYSVRLPPRAQLLSYDQVHRKVRDFAALAPDRRLAACNGLVFVGDSYPPPGVEDLDPITLSDGPVVYFDQRSGRKVADCSYWHCVKNNKYCDATCPVREWTCMGIDSGQPETEDEARYRALRIIKEPSEREIRSIERALQMPAGAAPMSNYFRYYYAAPERRERWIEGRFIATHLMPNVDKPEEDVGLGVRDGNLLPKVSGAGCELIAVRYHPRERAVTSIRCAGE